MEPVLGEVMIGWIFLGNRDNGYNDLKNEYSRCKLNKKSNDIAVCISLALLGRLGFVDPGLVYPLFCPHLISKLKKEFNKFRYNIFVFVSRYSR